MRFEELVSLTGNLPCFDIALLAQAAGAEKSRQALRVQLSRWVAHGKIIALRRGFYRLAEPFAQTPAEPSELSALLYRPSYLSDHWALAYYDLIPERVVELTAVTTRPPTRYPNAVGLFSYRHIKREAFFGYKKTQFAYRPLFVAEPEKALLDNWHFAQGEWTLERMSQMRYQNTGIIDAARLREYAARFASPRLTQATALWLENFQAKIADGEEVLP